MKTIKVPVSGLQILDYEKLGFQVLRIRKPEHGDYLELALPENWALDDNTSDTDRLIYGKNFLRGYITKNMPSNFMTMLCRYDYFAAKGNAILVDNQTRDEGIVMFEYDSTPRGIDFPEGVDWQVIEQANKWFISQGLADYKNPCAYWE